MAGRHMKVSDGESLTPSASTDAATSDSASEAAAEAPLEVVSAAAGTALASASKSDEKVVYGLGKKPSGGIGRRRRSSSGHHHHHHHHHGRRRSRRRKRINPIVGVLLILLFGVLCAGAVWASRLGGKMSMGEEAKTLTAALEPQDEESTAFYVLVVGSDAREGDTVSRGDVLMLTRVDPDTGKVTLVSVPRDTMVNISGAVGTQKINAAYAYGGASSAVYELSKFSGVPISHYVEIDFEGFKKLIDRLGGVTVNVPEAVGDIPAGPQVLDGETALRYARNRHDASGGDFGRAQAQRLIVQAAVRQIMQSNPLEIPGLIEELAQCVSTDYSVTDLVALALQFRGGKITMYSCACPSYALWQDGVSYVGTMFDEWRDMMKRVDAGLDPNDTSMDIPEPQKSNEKLGQAANSEAPKDYHDLANSSMTTDSVAKTDNVTTIEE